MAFSSGQKSYSRLPIRTNPLELNDKSTSRRICMHLVCYRTDPHPPELVPARSERAWMDAMGDRFPYRCTPLTMANSTGWELLCPADVEASWNGGHGLHDLVIETGERSPAFVQSHFGNGVLSFHPGYLFRTDPGWAIWCRGAPNTAKDGIAALDGLVETDWAPFSFTMNWRFTRPGTVHFAKGEPFCFILPLPHIDIESIRPTIAPLSADPELAAEYLAWRDSRNEFNSGLHQRDPAAVKKKWQRFYVAGKTPKGALAPDTHRTRRKMHAPDLAGDKLRHEPKPDEAEQAVAVAAAPVPDTRAHSSLPEPCKQNLIWVASYPKSGNTWVRAFIHNLLKEISGDRQPQDINRMNEHTVWEIAGPPFEQILGKPLTEAKQSEIEAARPKVQHRLANTRSEPFFVKTHLCVGSEHGHPTINLNATLAAVYVVRNPLDVAISYAHHTTMTIDSIIASMANKAQRTPGTPRSVYEVLGSWSQNVSSWLGVTDRPIHVIRYEDLEANPTRPFGMLARFLGLAPSEDQLKAAIARSCFAELRRQEAENGFKERPETSKVFFREGRSGQWRDVLTPAQVQEIIRVHAPMMQRLGYLLPDCGAPIRLRQMA